ncbi:MAG: tRNA (adenosine(37)-N6)-threonylcarbamoyltransferase complex dimerization subunit type 1 TsaB [Oscillospiraceae bacterium]|nr:tRNA (adenosine(37)-N6)-threonylcarbamoyltransferase complex dimerization subunit type 1 TsaB [Oscillospiraceae bacterium]
MNVLALDASAVSASVCVMEDGHILGDSFVNIKQTHSQTLMVMVQSLLETTGVSLSDIDLFGVSAGPGSFTGVRIGVACVKGMAMAQGKPCAGVSTLAAMAENLRDSDGIVCAVMDARCQQVYNALFRVKQGVITRLSDDRPIAIASLAEECKGFSEPIYLVGDGAALCSRAEGFSALPQVRLVSEALRYQRASGVASCAMAMAQQGKTVSAGELSPIYLRLPQAERELKRKQNLERK